MMVPTLLLVSLLLILAHAQENKTNDSHSSFSRGLAAQGARMTQPVTPRVSRARYPETDPQICLAFLSCCGRTDLLNNSIAAAIRHLEEDEPGGLRYEFAWVDNGSGSDLTTPILESYQIEHALTLQQNSGLAFGMNLLISNLCRAPYIMLMEEDWLYLDHLVVEQTEARKRAISTALALAEQGNLTSFDGRPVMGVFLRPETYLGFLKYPYAHDWGQTNVNLTSFAAPECDASQASSSTACASTDDLSSVPVDYQIFCADNSFASGYVWGSYTNGAGLYSREALADIGRMYGEPGDVFHDRYVEANYAYRAGLKYCHAATRLGHCQDVNDPKCTAAFYHVGGGRGTRPQTADGSKCADHSWILYGTPAYDKYMKNRGSDEPICSEEDLREMRDARTKEADSAGYREEVKERNQQVFETEREKREEMKRNARIIRKADNAVLRQHLAWAAGMTDEEIAAFADRLEKYADSPHPLNGFWDSHGRPLV